MYVNVCKMDCLCIAANTLAGVDAFASEVSRFYHQEGTVAYNGLLATYYHDVRAFAGMAPHMSPNGDVAVIVASDTKLGSMLCRRCDGELRAGVGLFEQSFPSPILCPPPPVPSVVDGTLCPGICFPLLSPQAPSTEAPVGAVVPVGAHL
jgi:hypothetical protein